MMGDECGEGAANAAVPTVRARIHRLLSEAGVSFRRITHAPTRTSEASAAARGEPLEVGGKALVVKVDDTFRLFVLSAHRRLDSGAVRAYFGARKSRFASAEELWELTGLVPGSVPPFGTPILPFDLHADPSVFENDRIAFNAGSLTDSVVMATADYRALAKPVVFPFTV